MDIHNRRHKLTRQEHLNNYDKLRQRMKTQLSSASKGQASSIMLDNIDELTRLYGAIQQDKLRLDTKIQLEDSEVFKEASDFAAINVRNIRLGDAGISINDEEFLTCLKQFAGRQTEEDDSDEEEEADEYSFNKTNWLKLGILYQQVSKKPISVDFLNGPLATERRKATVRTRIVDDTRSGSLTTAANVNPEDIVINEEHNTAYMVRMVYQTYLEKLEQSEDSEQGMNFFKFFIDPESFGQSVENLFYTSFLIKDGRLKLYQHEGIPYIQPVTQQELQELQQSDGNISNHHQIARFNYKAWQYYIEEFDIDSCFLGHRDEIPEDEIPDNELEI
ncbi:Non-structural maintenance of chromosome element 4 [Spathaspora sp. JA1]|nr:Non-structural maintenance of chromosome element 4 [Spathaspora sp. JA1]